MPKGLQASADTINLDMVVTVTKDIVFSDLNGEIAILNIKNGEYYGLDNVGAFIWSVIQEPTPLSRVRDLLLEEYAVDPKQCEHDLLVLFQNLLSVGLIEVHNDGAA
ncbi:MAG: PqqD family protein [Herpetosiphon sp.]